jgi:hypothetical protein
MNVPVDPRRIQEAEGGGLLNPHALFALGDFHVFSVISLALSCTQMASFAGYGAPRVHQEIDADCH